MSRRFFDRLAEPPRQLPLGVRLYAVFGGAGCLSQVGWGLLALTSIVGWAFAGNADAWSPLVFRMLATAQAEAVVTSMRETSASEGRTRVREVSYRFTAPDGQERSGRSYVRGSAPNPGQRVIVEFLEAWPAVSRVQGMRRGLFGPGASFALIFPAVPLGMVCFSVGSGLRLSRLLARGRLAAAELKSKVQTNTMKGQPVMKLTFEFVAGDGQRYEASETTTDTKALEDERSERLLYLPTEPTSATLVDALPKAIQASEDGGLRLAGATALAVLVLPVLTILGNAFAAYLMLFR
jgi:hypothetical protein